MCGIVGYIGERQALPNLLEGLRRLEYRGYDSAGVATLNTTYKLIKVVKAEGELSKLIAQTEKFNLPENIGIGHTRWATHGVPSEKNSHPHTSDTNTIALVHNGIIENDRTLYKYINEVRPVIKRSDTDTEVLAHLIDINLIDQGNNGSFELAFIKALLAVDGTFGLALVTTYEPDKIFCARRGSPLVIGIGQGEYFIASDPAAFAAQTKEYVTLADNEYAIVTKSGYEVKKLATKAVAVKKDIEKLDYDLDQIEKGGYPHFMLKEINEQPDSIKNCLSGRLSLNMDAVKLGGLELYEDQLIKTDKITIVACGTSYYAALIFERMLEQYAGINAEVEYASEYQYSHSIINDGDIVFFISQSGETADTIGAVKRAQANGAIALGIVNVVGSTLPGLTDAGVYIHAGPEIGVASTKAFTSQVTAAALIAVYIAQLKGKFPANIYNIVFALSSLPAKVKEALACELNVIDIAKKFTKKFRKTKNFLYLGREYNYPVALEGALKLKEISYIHAEGQPAGEMKHGPIALIDKKMPVVVVATDDHNYDKIVNNIREVKTREGKVIAVITDDNTDLAEMVDYTISVPKTVDLLQPIISVIPLQLLAYHIAVRLGRNVDRPKNLAKAVTVE